MSRSGVCTQVPSSVLVPISRLVFFRVLILVPVLLFVLGLGPGLGLGLGTRGSWG